MLTVLEGLVECQRELILGLHRRRPRQRQGAGTELVRWFKLTRHQQQEAVGSRDDLRLIP